MNAVLFGNGGLDGVQLLARFGHFLLLSLLAVGGALATAPDMQRYVVGERGWISDADFTSSIALAQAAPGPNVLFVAVVGWNIAGLAGVAATMAGNLLPSTLLVLSLDRWGERHRDAHGLRAFKAGMAPLTVGLLMSTGWVLSEPLRDQWQAIAVIVATTALMLRTRIGPLWPIGAGALLGAFGWI